MKQTKTSIYKLRSTRFCRLVTVMLTMIASVSVFGEGFDTFYEPSVGDHNGDGLQDLYIKHSPPILVLALEVDTPIALSSSNAGNVLLEQNVDGSFDVVTGFTQAQLSGFLPSSAITLHQRDANQDGTQDLIVTGIESTIGGDDQILFWTPINGVTNTSIDESFKSFVADFRNWIADDNYYVDNAPTMTVSVPQTTSQGWYYYASTARGASAALLACIAQHSTSDCTGAFLGVLSSVFSSTVCANLAVGGISCDLPGYHVFGISQSTTIVDVQVPDLSVFDQDAIDLTSLIIGIFLGEVVEYDDLKEVETIWNSHLAEPTSIGTEAQQCQDAPAVVTSGRNIVATAPIVVCAVAAVIVGSVIADVMSDIIEIIVEHGVFSDGSATIPSPHDYVEEGAAYDFPLNPFDRGVCPPPNGNGSLRAAINVLRAKTDWREFEDLNSNSGSYEGHLNKILLNRARIEVLKKFHRDLCGEEA